MDKACWLEGPRLVCQNETVCYLDRTPDKYIKKYIKQQPEQFWDTLLELAITYHKTHVHVELSDQGGQVVLQ